MKDNVELQLFPSIDNHTNYNPDSTGESSFHQDSRSHAQVDDASFVVIDPRRQSGDEDDDSVCIDDFDAEYQNAIDVLRTGGGANGESSNNRSGNSDFDAYNERVAREVVLREKVQRRQQRQQRVKYLQSSRSYGNYFSESSGADTFTPSHGYDNFNGRRQNPNYNHQLNKLNTPYTYEARQLDNISEASNNRAIQPDDDASFVTLDVDALESEDDSDNDEEESLLSTDNGHSYVPKLKRRLYGRHLQMMALGAAFGVGVLLNAGQTFFYSGPLGTLLGYIIMGSVVMVTMFALCEMVALAPGEAGIPAIASRFVDRSLGFSLGLCYWLSCAMALPSEITAGAIMLTYYPELTLPTQGITVWITFFLVIVLVVNLFDAGTFGEIQFAASFIAILLFIFLMIFMFALNNGDFGDQGRIGFRYWDYSKSRFDKNFIYGAFRPVYPLEMTPLDNGTLSIKGIDGATGNFVQVWNAICRAAFSYVGTEVVFMTAGEVRNPRKSVPAAAKKIFIRITCFYILAIFAISINVFAGDPRLINLLPEVYSKGVSGNITENGIGGCVTGHVSWGSSMPGSNSSPWILAMQSIGNCSMAAGINSTFVFFALHAGICHLYAASRTLYGLSAQGMIWSGFSKCTYAGVPYVAVITSFAFGMLAYLTTNNTSAQVFDWLLSMTTSAGLMVYAGINFAFLRFRKGLKLRPDIASRSGDLYPFKSPLQPYAAYYGLIMNLLVAIFWGVPLFFSNSWSTREFFTDYVSLMVLVVSYVAHKLITKSPLIPLAELDLDSGRKEMDRAGWQEDRVYKKGWVGYLMSIWARVGTTIRMAKS